MPENLSTLLRSTCRSIPAVASKMASDRAASTTSAAPGSTVSAPDPTCVGL